MHLSRLSIRSPNSVSISGKISDGGKGGGVAYFDRERTHRQRLKNDMTHTHQWALGARNTCIFFYLGYLLIVDELDSLSRQWGSLFTAAWLG